MDVSVSQHLPLLVCHGCREQIALPHRSQEAIVLGRSYLPTGDQSLVFLCPLCAHLSVYWESDILVPSAPTSAPLLAPVGIVRRVEFSCAHENCDLPIVLHSIDAVGISRDEIVRKVDKANPRPKCANGHILPVNRHIDTLNVVD